MWSETEGLLSAERLLSCLATVSRDLKLHNEQSLEQDTVNRALRFSIQVVVEVADISHVMNTSNFTAIFSFS